MKQSLETLISEALSALQAADEIPSLPVSIHLEMTKDKQFGDWASNIAMILAKTAKQPPRQLAEKIVQHLPESPLIKKVEIAGPGFINFYLNADARAQVVSDILHQKTAYGRSQIGRGKRILIEFLSSNPTGPLHVGHGRHAALGAVIANLLNAVGFKTYREYYVNDAGRQMDILAVSVWMRYLTLCGETVPFPANGYRGDYVLDIAKLLQAAVKARYHVKAADVLADLPADEAEGGDKELYTDALIARAKQLLGEGYIGVYDHSLDNMMKDIRDDLTEFGVHYDNWFSERQFVATGAVKNTIERLKASGYTEMRDDALWFRSTAFGDEKDRVLIRSNGQYTYFAPDIAYHFNKFERGFDLAIDIFGADHHGYLPRMKAAMQAGKIDPERLILLLVQFVSLYRGQEPVSMSTRGGNFVTLRELRQEVGNDAARFFYVMRKSEQPMDFDLELAKAQSNDNPVFYVQYAYARINSVLKQLADRALEFNSEQGLAELALLTEEEEQGLLNTLVRYPAMITNAAVNYEPHLLTNYLRDLASDFHRYYNAHHFLVDDVKVRNARLALVMATKQVLLNGFELLGISAPESM